jgi:hypothetical protein
MRLLCFGGHRKREGLRRGSLVVPLVPYRLISRRSKTIPIAPRNMRDFGSCTELGRELGWARIAGLGGAAMWRLVARWQVSRTHSSSPRGPLLGRADEVIE